MKTVRTRRTQKQLTVAVVKVSSRGRIVIPREMRIRLNIEPGQKVSITSKDGLIYLVPIRQLRKSERGDLPKLKPFVREGKMEDPSRFKQVFETPPPRLGKPLNPPPSKMKRIWQAAV